jgi:predicted aspartyl protease
MATFSVEAIVANLHEATRRQVVQLLVDTGATYTTLPREVVDAIGARCVGTRRVVLASGSQDEWPVAAILLAIGRQEAPTLCFVGPEGGPALLGAVSLEELGLGVDPVERRLIEVAGYVRAVP